MPNRESLNKERTKQANSNAKFLAIMIPLFITVWGVLMFFYNMVNPQDFTELPQNIRESHITSLFYRATPWQFPISLTDIGSGIPISLTDNIPLMAILYKILNIPTQQYFGMWLLLSFTLYTFFAYRISKNIFPKNPLVAGIGSLIFLLLPFIWYHPSYIPWFGGQWILLWAYSLYFKKKNIISQEWYGLMIIAPLIHPYFAFTTFGIMFTDILNIYLSSSNLSSQKAATSFSNFMTLGFLCLGITGTFYLSSYIDYTAIPTPLSFSNHIDNSYNISYLSLGLGSILGVGISMAIMIYHAKTKRYLYYYRPLIGYLLFLVFCSILGGIQITNDFIIPINLGTWITKYITPILTSGPRFFIPILFLAPIIILHTSYGLENSKKHLGTCFLIGVLTIQILLFSPTLAQTHKKYQPLNFSSLEFLKNTKSLEWIYPNNISYRPECYDVLAYYAFQNNLSINAASVMRFPTGYQENIQKQSKQFFNKNFKIDTIYILNPHDIPKDFSDFGIIHPLNTVTLFKPIVLNTSLK